jgi:dTMP kinase
MKRGVFVTFEGGDGAGKTTLVQALARSLAQKGMQTLSTRAPGGTALGERVRELLLHGQEFSIAKRAELYLFLADRAQHVEQVIRPALEEGKIVLCDRFNDSTIAYQGHARGLTEEKVEAECAFACDHL